MSPLIFSMSVSLDGFVAGPGGDISWGAPDEELHRFHNEQVREQAGQICGRGLYETMLFWETAEPHEPSQPEVMREFAEIWTPLPKWVFSRTLDSVEGTSTLLRGELGEEVRRLKAESPGPIGVGGAGIAGELMRLGLIDEWRLFVSPVLLGGGTPYFPVLETQQPLRLLERRSFADGQVQYLRYAR